MSTIPRNGLILELLFLGNADDTSGGGHHAAVHGAVPTADRFGNQAGAYLFDGEDDYVVVAAPPRRRSADFTLSIWARIDVMEVDGWSNCFICQDDGNDDDQSRRIFQLSANDGRIVWHRMTCTGDPASKKQARVGMWQHFVAVVSHRVHRLYVDGELQDSVRHALQAHDHEPIYIGRKGTPEPYFFVRGAIDDVRMYDRALEDGEIRSLYGEGGYQPRRGQQTGDLISGVWGTGDDELLDLSFDGVSVSGSITAGRRGNRAAIRRGTFDAATGALRLEGEARRPDGPALVEYVIDGQIDKGRLRVHYRVGDHEGDAILSRPPAWLWLRKRTRVIGRRAVHAIEPFLVPVVRALRARKRPSKATNLRALRERQESLASLVFRDATVEDIPRLAALHVKTWSATYPHVRRPPTYAIREPQWREAFAKQDGTWFCIVIENAQRELIGFAKGIRHGTHRGDLNKIYLLTEYQRLGIGRRLLGHVVRRFLADGITTMTLSADAANPSCRFYLAMGAENQRDDNGRVHQGAFIWRDLPGLAEMCPVDVR